MFIDVFCLLEMKYFRQFVNNLLEDTNNIIIIIIIIIKNTVHNYCCVERERT